MANTKVVGFKMPDLIDCFGIYYLLIPVTTLNVKVEIHQPWKSFYGDKLTWNLCT